MEEFYIVIDSQKQGPFDLISMIKKVKNRIVTAETKVSVGNSENFVNASEIEQLNTLLEEHGSNGEESSSSNYDRAPSFGIGRSFSEGVNLWLKYVLSFTILSGVILAVAFSLSKGLGKVSVFAEYPTIGNYIVSVITTFLYVIFFNYILLAKRNQTTQIAPFLKVIGGRLSSILLLASIFSVYTIAYGVSELIGLAVLVGLMIFSTFYAFAPFLIFDRNMSFAKAAGTSMRKVGKSGVDNFGVILAMIAINLVVAIVPAFFAKELFVFGLFISIPITVSALAFIYDEMSS